MRNVAKFLKQNWRVLVMVVPLVRRGYRILFHKKKEIDMSETLSPNKITGGEGVRLGAQVLNNIADALEDPVTPNEISKDEWLEIGREALADAWEAYRN